MGAIGDRKKKGRRNEMKEWTDDNSPPDPDPEPF
jgi:hypothetical protein